MRWFLLRDRRHEGPYTKEEVIEALRAGRIDSKDYLLSEDGESDQRSFAYITVSDVVGKDFVSNLEEEKGEHRFIIKLPSPNTESDKGKTPKLELLKSEFDSRVNSAQLVGLKSENTQGGGTHGTHGTHNEKDEATFNFEAEEPSSFLRFSLKSLLIVLPAIAAVLFMMGSDTWKKITDIFSSDREVASLHSPQPGAVNITRPQANIPPTFHPGATVMPSPSMNRPPTVDLPKVERRDEEVPVVKEPGPDDKTSEPEVKIKSKARRGLSRHFHNHQDTNRQDTGDEEDATGAEDENGDINENDVTQPSEENNTDEAEY